MTSIPQAQPIRLVPTALCLAALLLLGIVDYLVSYHICLVFLYAVPIGIAAVMSRPLIALVMAVAAVVISRGGDLLSGMPYPGDGVFLCNCAIPLAFFIILIASLFLLNRGRTKLEATVQHRNHDLLREMHERGRLEREILQLSERAQSPFGRELYDLVSHELADLAIDTHLLAQNLAPLNSAEAQRARAIAAKVDSALSKARSLTALPKSA